MKHSLSSVPTPEAKPVPRPLVRPRLQTVRRYSGPTSLAISPDGSRLAFVSLQNRFAIVRDAAVAGGEPRVAIAIDGAAVYGICWSPTGDLYYTADRGGTERWQVYVRRSDGRFEDFAVDEGEHVQHHLSGSAASPDGRWVAISTNARNPTDVDVAIVDAQTKRQRLVITEPAWHVVGAWSPDGRWLSIMRVSQNTDQDLVAIDTASGERIELTPHSDEMQNVPAGWLADGKLLAITDRDSDFLHLETIDVGTRARQIFDRPEWDVALAATSSDGRGVVWTVNEDGYSRLRWRLDGGPSGERETDGVVGDLAVALGGHRAAYALWSNSGPQEVRILDLVTGEDRVLLHGDAFPEYSDRPRSVRIPGTEGAIPAYIWRPVGVQGPTPVLLAIHGGPEAQAPPRLFPIVLAWLLQRGVAVVAPNIHGSTGYGKAWQRRIHHDWGGIDLADLRSVAEWMRSDPGFDPKRMGVMGGSYGGFATLTCVTRLPEYWCCAVDLFGPSNLVTMLENDPPNWRRWNRLWIGDLETDREKLIERSPITYVENARCPLLVFQGANDPRVPKGESEQLVASLRALGRPVEYVSFEGEGHGLFGRDADRTVHERTLEFFERHLLA